MKYTVSYKELLLNDGYMLKEDLFDTKVKQNYYEIDENDPVYLTFTGNVLPLIVYRTVYKIFSAQSKVEKGKAVEIGVLSKLGLYFLLSGLLIQSSLSVGKLIIKTKQKKDKLKRKKEEKTTESVQYISDEYLDETTKTDSLKNLLSETYKMIFEDDEKKEEERKKEDSIKNQILKSLKLLVTVRRISFDISRRVADMYFGSTRIIYLIATVGIMFFSYLLISLGTLMIKADVWEMKELKDGLKAICDKIYTKASVIYYNSKTDFFRGISKIFWSFLVATVKNLPATIASTLSGIWNAIRRIPEMLKSFFGSKEIKKDGFLVAGDTILLRETAVLKEAVNLGIFGIIGNVLKKILKFIFSRYGLLAIGVLIVIKAFMSVPSGTEIDRMYKNLANVVTKDAEEAKEKAIDGSKEVLLGQIKKLKDSIDKNTKLDNATKTKFKKDLDKLEKEADKAKDDKDLQEAANKLAAIEKEMSEAEKTGAETGAQNIDDEKQKLLKRIEEVRALIDKSLLSDPMKNLYRNSVNEIENKVKVAQSIDVLKKQEYALNGLEFPTVESKREKILKQIEAEEKSINSSTSLNKQTKDVLIDNLNDIKKNVDNAKTLEDFNKLHRDLAKLRAMKKNIHK